MLEASEWNLERAIKIYHMGPNYFKTYYPNHHEKFQKHSSNTIEANGEGLSRNQKLYDASEGILNFELINLSPNISQIIM